MSKPHFQPAGFHSVTPSLNLSNASEGIAFYTKVFGAVEQYRLAGADGKIMHAEFKIGDSIIMCNDEMPNWGALGPLSVGGASSTLMLYVEDVDAVYAKAIEEGAASIMPPTNQFWGDRNAAVVCPFGYKWSLATHIEDVSEEEIQSRAAAWTKEAASGCADQSS